MFQRFWALRPPQGWGFKAPRENEDTGDADAGGIGLELTSANRGSPKVHR